MARGRTCDLLLTERLESAEVLWRHFVSSTSGSVEVRLRDGDRLRSGEFSAVLNRVISPPLTQLARADWEDSAYARSEQVAFSLSWLHALAPVVINPPAARGLAGAWRSPLEWRMLALDAGFEVEAFDADSDAHEPAHGVPLSPAPGMVIGESAFGMAALPGVAGPAIRLARLAETPVLGLWFCSGREGRFTMATPHPDLALGREAGLDALERLLDA